MSKTNNQTINTYNACVQQYVTGTPQEVTGAVKDWIDDALRGLPYDAKILEVGAGFGRDTSYIEGLGYRVLCTDATPAFVELLRSKGIDARELNVLTDDLPSKLSLVFANAVLLHFTVDEMRVVLQKIYNALLPGGSTAFTLKEGEGEDWSDKKLGAPRYFCYWTADAISQALKEVGFCDIAVSRDESKPGKVWLQVVASK